MRWILTIAMMAGTLGCEADTSTAPTSNAVATMKAALPEAAATSILLPGADASGVEHASFYSFTRGVTYGVNLLVTSIAVVVQDVVDREPSSTDGETFAVWGPWTDALAPVTWRVRADLDGDTVEYKIEGWPKDESDAAAKVVLAGRSSIAARTGSWTYDLTEANRLDPIAQDSRGQVSVAFELADTRTIEVTFSDVEGPRAPTPTSTLYRYAEAPDGAGTFDYISNLNIHDEEPEKDRRELLQIRTRWQADGPGRADVFASGGDLSDGVEVGVIQCWSATFEQTYSHFDFDVGEVSEGDADACPFTDVERPAFDQFDPAAFADEALVSALPTADDFALGLRPLADPVAEPASYFRLALGVLLGVESQVAAILRVLRAVTRLPATACDAQGCTWGPWTDWSTRVTSRVVVERAGDDRYTYSLSMKYFGEPASAWRQVVEGGFVEADGDDGQGWFGFDNDALAEVDPNHEATGQVRVEYARLGIGAALAMRVDGALPARYSVSVVDGAGHLDARFPADIHEDDDPEKDAMETLEARVRWQSNGAGVGDVVALDGDLGQSSVASVECWDERAARTHFDFAIRGPRLDTLPDTDGPGCVFTDWQGPVFQPLGDE